ncbi:hypothetical protein [Paractinoplanes lichenicola]|uniref:Uncharacterized protein n=1 Tax=Paractinoplanes lichenicola TaxID=2802976 RepID=A0ABS1VV96_9ACTN|nr:hypothetical protein [Actinoplanes lichenicola]MBL7258376.1 hypothetical protein [Actinoplanes lichenicola]
MTDELIQAAYEKIASAAPPPERIRARLQARSRSHRQRRAVLAGAGALGATALTVPFVHFLRGGSPPETAPIDAVTASAPPPKPAATAPLRYALGWLPAGVGEQYREATTDGGTRTWLLDGLTYPTDYTVAKGVTLAVGERSEDNAGTPVTIGDVTGRLVVTDSSFVEWTPKGGPTMIVTVYGLPGSTEVALRMARSVRPTRATIPVWIRSPWIPDRFRGSTSARLIPLAGGGWRQELTYAAPRFTQVLRIVAGTAKPSDPTQLQRQRPDGTWLWIPEHPADMVGLEPFEPPTTAEATRLLDELVCVTPDLEWVGGRL